MPQPPTVNTLSSTACPDPPKRNVTPNQHKRRPKADRMFQKRHIQGPIDSILVIRGMNHGNFGVARGVFGHSNPKRKRGTRTVATPPSLTLRVTMAHPASTRNAASKLALYPGSQAPAWEPGQKKGGGFAPLALHWTRSSGRSKRFTRSRSVLPYRMPRQRPPGWAGNQPP